MSFVDTVSLLSVFAGGFFLGMGIEKHNAGKRFLKMAEELERLMGVKR